MNFFSNLFVAIDQLGNVLAGGNPDNTISSRVGYYTRDFDESKIAFHWKFFRNIIDFAFYPVDGKNHCQEAYFNDAGEVFDEGTNDYLVIIALAVIVVPCCIIITIFLYSLYALGLVSPKKINRNEKIKHRLKIAEARLNGALQELNTHKVKVDKELDEALDKTQLTLNQISEKINGILSMNRRLQSFKKEKAKDKVNQDDNENSPS